MIAMEPNLEELKKYCESNQNVRLAFIFGSSVKGLAGEDSDVDIGVHVRDTGKEEQIWMELSRLMGKEVDLVVLNEAPASLASNILKTGVPLVIKDINLYWDFYLSKTLEAEDFNEFAESYWEIYQRSTSLAPEDKTRLIERVQFLESEFQEIEEFKRLTYKEYLEEKGKRRNIERWTENVVTATIDIAKIILASEKKEVPKTYEQALQHFGLFAGLDEEGAVKLSSFARLRNILAHQYLDITFERIRGFIKDATPVYSVVMGFLRTKI
jgi:uncharacterized protein YutE (UPF0331/DUF86 family)/predicted nucleotidyltransferase